MSDIIQLAGGYYQPGLSFREYRFLHRTLEEDLPVVNSSILKEETTIDMKSVVYPDPKEEELAEGKEAFVLGDALHKAVLEPEFWERRDDFFILSETSGLASKASMSARELNPDKIVIDKDGDILERAKLMREAILSDDQARQWVAPDDVTPYTELTGVAPDPDGQFVRKIRIDLAVGLQPSEPYGDYLLDIKSVDPGKIRPRKFKWQIEDFGYRIQGAYYLDTDSIIRTGSIDNPRSQFIIIAVEKKYPFKVMVYELDPSKMVEAREIYMERLAMLAHALRHDEWQGFEYRAPFII